VAPEALLRLDTLFGNHPAFSRACAAVLLGALSVFAALIYPEGHDAFTLSTSSSRVV
jgi:uncharacterized membrane protein YjjB (DUF3815 family)